METNNNPSRDDRFSIHKGKYTGPPLVLDQPMFRVGERLNPKKFLKSERGVYLEAIKNEGGDSKLIDFISECYSIEVAGVTRGFCHGSVDLDAAPSSLFSSMSWRYHLLFRGMIGKNSYTYIHPVALVSQGCMYGLML